MMIQSRKQFSLYDTMESLWRVFKQFTPLIAPIFAIIFYDSLITGRFQIGELVLFRYNPPLNNVFFARPIEIWPDLQDWYDDDAMMRSVWASLVRVIYGFVLGAIPAIFLGLLMGTFPVIYALFQPLAEAFYAIPKIAFIPLVIFLYGLSEKGLVRIIAFSVFFLVLLSVVKTIQQIDPKHREVARSFGAGVFQVFFTVILPASMPGIITSLQLGMGFALVVIVGAEFLSSSDGSGIGYQIWEAREDFAIVRYFSGLVVIGVMGYGLAWVMQRFNKMLIPWQPAARSPQPTYLQQRLNMYWRAMRPWSFVATLAPLMVGSAIAGYDRATRYATMPEIISLRPKLAVAGYDWTFDWVVLALTVVGAVAFQAGTNLVNDYYDHRKGADNEKSLGIGGTIQRGEMTPLSVLLYGLACFALGSVIGLYLVSISGTFILWLGLFSLAAGFFYTAGPVALAYVGLGELTVGVFMGPVVVIGAYYVQVRAFNIEPVLAALPIALLVAAILHVNNLRDMEHDRAVGKRTLATLLGRRYANVEYYVLVSGAYVVQVMLVISGIAPVYTLVALVSLPSALSLMYRVAANPPPPALNPVLRRTAQLHWRFGLLLTAGWFFAMIEAWYQAALNS
jgi:1,4-dihydroxy-2-naphthoate octaprenyltransferase